MYTTISVGPRGQGMVLDLARRADSRPKVVISRLVSKSKSLHIGIQVAYPLSEPELLLFKTFPKGGKCSEPLDLLLFAKTGLSVSHLLTY